ncbi:MULTISPECIES: hypothetical protein [Neisseria]|uniref:Porin n=1 Tax=Neisseria musculi TaxID=1815583 RepID=A0A7H1M864_9NEIS|nr:MULTISPECIES: hypothetical protein [Neisseria]MBF0802881.1 hypothetical protein [Neisseria sp. 19428wB4_WF04]QNT57829.1 hypothetical protein H7A79_0640 [Neisseria musculi]TFU44420.1 hypothetical protein E4T99_00610 [Neisseria sp. WF04]
MNAKKILSFLCASLFAAPAFAANTDAALTTTDDYVNAGAKRASRDFNIIPDRLGIHGTIRARADAGDTAASYTAVPNPANNTVSHLNADLWLSARIYKDWKIVTQIEPQIDLETGKFNGDHDVPMNKLYAEGTVYDKIKARVGKFGAFSSYGRVLDNEVTGGELFFDYKFPTKVAVARVTKHLNDNPWGVEVRREMMVSAQTVVPLSDKVNIGATAVYLDNVKQPDNSRKNAVFGEIGADVKFNDTWGAMAAYSRSNLTGVKDSAGKKVSPDGIFAGVKFKNADWATRNSYDVFFNLRRVGAMSGISSVEDYSKNVQGAQIGMNYVPYKNFKLNAFYLHGKQVNATAGNSKQDVNVVRGQIEYKF